jgi:hypothetical protein
VPSTAHIHIHFLARMQAHGTHPSHSCTHTFKHALHKSHTHHTHTQTISPPFSLSLALSLARALSRARFLSRARTCALSLSAPPLPPPPIPSPLLSFSLLRALLHPPLALSLCPHVGTCPEAHEGPSDASRPSINGLPLVHSSRALAAEDREQVPDLSWRGLLLSFGCVDMCARACACVCARSHSRTQARMRISAISMLACIGICMRIRMLACIASIHA